MQDLLYEFYIFLVSSPLGLCLELRSQAATRRSAHHPSTCA